MKFLEWLKQYWFLIVAFSAMSVAWGQQTLKVQTLEEAVKRQAEIQTQVSTLKAQSDRVDERTRMMLENQQRMERMVETLLTRDNRVAAVAPPPVGRAAQ